MTTRIDAGLEPTACGPTVEAVTVRRRFLNPIWLLASLPGYIGWRLLSAFPLGPVAICAGMGLLIACCVVIPWSVRHRMIRKPALEAVLAWVGVLSMGFFSSVFVFTVLRDFILLCAWGLLSAAHFGSLVATSARWALALALAVTGAGLVVARRRPRVIRVDIPIANLPAPLHGFSIAQISDLHVGPTIKRRFVERIVALVNGLKADLIAVTGDLVDGSVQDLAHHTAPLAGLAASHGAYFVTGNHEYYSGERSWTAEIRRLGLRVLKNEHVVLAHQGGSVILAGVTDLSAHHFDAGERSDPALALRGSPAGPGARILLAHQPNSAPAAARAGFDIQLSGHTHGGQFWPWNLFIGFFQPFTGGLYRLQGLWIYVCRGTGYWGPPNRFGVPPEIILIRLTPAAP